MLNIWNRPSKPNEEKTIDTPRRIVEKQIKQIPPVTPNELLNAIKVHINPEKAPGFDVIRGALETTAQKNHSQTNTSIQCRIPTEICTSLLGSNGSDYTETRKACYWSYLLKANIAITNTVETVRKLLKRLKPILDEKQIIPTHQFGFRKNHSTTDQIHRITNNRKDTKGEAGLLLYLFRCGPSIR